MIATRIPQIVKIENLSLKYGARSISNFFILGPLAGELLVDDLIKQLGNPRTKIRYWSLFCLTKIHSKNELLEEMFAAESTEANLASFRERGKHLTNLSFGSSAYQNCRLDQLKTSGVFAFLTAQLSLNFKPLWEMTLKVIESHAAQSDLIDKLWSTWFQIFQNVNYEAAKITGNASKADDIDFAHFRNQLLNILTNCPRLTKLAEKNNALICHEFLKVFLLCESQSPKGDGLLAYLKVFGKFTNLQSMSAFNEVKAVVKNALGHFQDKVRTAAIDFFVASYKDLRQHKVSLRFRRS